MWLGTFLQPAQAVKRHICNPAYLIASRYCSKTRQIPHALEILHFSIACLTSPSMCSARTFGKWHICIHFFVILHLYTAMVIFKSTNQDLIEVHNEAMWYITTKRPCARSLVLTDDMTANRSSSQIYSNATKPTGWVFASSQIQDRKPKDKENDVLWWLSQPAEGGCSKGLAECLKGRRAVVGDVHGF